MQQEINQLDKQSLTRIRDQINAALEMVADDLGLNITVGSCRYTAKNATLKVEIATLSDDGSIQNKEREDFKIWAPSYGLSSGDLGKTFESNGNTYEVCGLKRRSRKYPILAKRADGRMFKFAARYVKERI